jgi:hypothetical protein
MGWTAGNRVFRLQPGRIRQRCTRLCGDPACSRQWRSGYEAIRIARCRCKAQALVGNGPTFAGPLSSGAFQQEVITARPGLYIQVCFMNTQDGREHTQLGMARMFRIVK